MTPAPDPAEQLRVPARRIRTNVIRENLGAQQVVRAFGLGRSVPAGFDAQAEKGTGLAARVAETFAPGA
jgi:hypothetical protein